MNAKSFVSGIIIAVAGLLAVLLLMVDFCACSPAIYRWAMGRSGVYETAGVDRASLDAVAADVADYLMVGRDNKTGVNFDRTIIMDDEPRPELNEREREHLKDVQWLIVAAAFAFMALGLVSFLVAVCTPRTRSKGIGILVGTGLLLSLAFAVFIAIQVDFYSFFVAFHERLFTNELWYMNPETDLLIRMMPSGFFVSLAMVIGGVFAAATLAMIIAGIMLMRRKAARVL